MSNLLFQHDHTVAAWVGNKVGKPFDPPYSAFGVIGRDGTLIGGFVFNNYTKDSVELSLAGAGWASRDVWRSVLQYVFGQLGCSRMQIHTRRGNKPARKQASKLGMYFEGVSRRLYGSEDGLCYSLTRDDLPAFQKRWKL